MIYKAMEVIWIFGTDGQTDGQTGMIEGILGQIRPKAYFVVIRVPDPLLESDGKPV